MREQLLTGIQYLQAITALLQRGRNSHPTHGLYEAAEVQWWWSVPRSTDDFGQLFWFNELGQPEAAVTVTDFGDGTSALYEEPTLIVSVMPDATADWVAHVLKRGLAHVNENGIKALELEVDQADDLMRDLLFGHGFTVKGDGIVQCRLEAHGRPEIAPLPGGYHLFSRRDTTQFPHHMAQPHRLDVEQRLQQTSLYRPELDLVVLDSNNTPAAYGMFWHDPVTAIGVIEPMRTHDDHQGRGLARHILTVGIDLLAQAGAKEISIGYEPENPASGPLYRSAGFEPYQRTDVFSCHN